MVRLKISAVISAPGKMRPANKPIPIARSIPRKVAFAARWINLASAWMIPKPIPTMAAISGATSIAPMITAGLFNNKPRAAIPAARAIMTKKSTLGRAARRTCLYTSVRSSIERTGKKSLICHHIRRGIEPNRPSNFLMMTVVPLFCVAICWGTVPNKSWLKMLSLLAPSTVRSYPSASATIACITLSA